MSAARSRRDALVVAVLGNPATLPAPEDVDLDPFWSRFDAAAPWHVRAGFAIAVVVLGSVLPRLWGHRCGLRGLAPAAADEVLQRAAANPVCAPLCEAAKIVACFAYFADEGVESAARYR